MSKAKPIVIYVHRYPPETERLQWPALEVLGRALQPDYEGVYLCLGPGDGQRDEALRALWRVEELPATVDQANSRDKWRKTLYWYAHMGRLLRQIRELRPAVVICKETLPLLPGRVARLGFPTLIETSDWWWSILLGHWAWGRSLAAAMERFEVRGWNRPNVRATVSTAAEGRLLAAKGMEASRMVVIPPAQNPGVFCPLSPRPTPQELGLDPALSYVAICGIIRGGKGYDQLLDWWKIAVKTHPDWRLVIIGGAGGESWCRKEIARRGLEDWVIMTGWLPTKQDVNRWLNAMDAVLAHRRNSPDNQGIIPSALFNGLSTGRPVVASGLPGMAEIVRDGIDGFLYAPDDAASFVRAVERAMENPEAAAAVGRAGAARAAECFSPRKSAEAHRRLMDSLSAPN